MDTKGKIVIYQTSDGTTQLDVTLEKDTVWLTQAQMVDLFDSSKANISEHIKYIYAAKELEESLTVRKEGNRAVARELDYYNLDIIIAVGYRVNSKRGTQFRIWANNVLKEYLVKGVVINEQAKVKQLQEGLEQLKGILSLAIRPQVTTDEATGILRVISDYAHRLDILDQYDHQRLSIDPSHTKVVQQVRWWWLIRK